MFHNLDFSRVNESLILKIASGDKLLEQDGITKKE